MSTPGSSGKVGPTPIPDEPQAQSLVGEQVRPSFIFGMHSVSLGDQITGIHRVKKSAVVGTAIELVDVLCVSTDEGIFPLSRIAILSVQPPLFE